MSRSLWRVSWAPFEIYFRGLFGASEGPLEHLQAAWGNLSAVGGQEEDEDEDEEGEEGGGRIVGQSWAGLGRS